MNIFDANTILIIILGLGIAGVVVIIGIILMFVGGEGIEKRIKKYIDKPIDEIKISSSKDFTTFERIRYQINSTLGILDSQKVQLQLSSGNWKMTVTEFQLLRFFGSLFSYLLGYLIASNHLGASALAFIIYSIPGYMLSRAVIKRQKNFQDQLIDTLTLIRGAVSAGSSFLQSLDVVVSEMADPTAEEFQRVRRETELGFSLNQGLTNLANRMQSDDLFLVVNAININIQIGGNLSLILETVIGTIRDRIYLNNEIRSLTAYAHTVSYMLTLLPFVTALVLVLISPIYFENLFKPGITRLILLYALVSLIIGNIILRKISKIDV